MSAKRLVLAVTLTLMILAVAACTGTSIPTEMPTAVEQPTVALSTVAPTAVPTGQVAIATMWCQWAGLGSTVTAGEKGLSFACATGASAEAVGLFGEIESTDQGWMIAEAAISATVAGPTAGEITMVPVDYIELEDGTQCANAGHGATTGYDDKRLNYTCEVPSGEQMGLFGDVAVTATGWQITEAAFNVSAGGPTVTAPTTVTIRALGVPPLSTAAP